MEERNSREASRWQPLGAVQKGNALRAQCISRGASASHLTSLCTRGDVEALGPPGAVRDRGRSPECGRFQPRPPLSSDLRGRLSSHRPLSGTPLVREVQPAAVTPGLDVRTRLASERDQRASREEQAAGVCAAPSGR
eukprot:2170461-Pleurochrysis_carterae.AAC.2